MFDQMTLPGFGEPISSPGSADGRKPCVSPDGKAPCGPEARPASRSLPPGSAADATTTAISVPRLSNWSGPAAPLCCSASRSPARKSSDVLQAALNGALEASLHGRGATIYSFALRPQVTPAGRRLFRLAASAPRTSGSGSSSGLSAWPTPTTRDWKDGGNPNVNVPLNGLLGRVAWLAGWPTPMAGTPAQKGYNAAGSTDSSRRTVALAGWGTPLAQQANGTPEAFLQRKRDSISRGASMGVSLSDLNMQVQAWTPGPARLTASGEMLIGSCAGMDAGGQLNPRFSLWLQGYPAAWASCGARAMRSCHKRPRRSSAPSVKASPQ